MHVSTFYMRIEMLKTKKEVCELLSLTRDGLTKLQQKDGRVKLEVRHKPPN